MLALALAALVASVPVTVSQQADAVSLTLYHTDGIETAELMQQSRARATFKRMPPPMSLVIVT